MKIFAISYFLALIAYSTTVIPLNEDQIIDSADFVLMGSIIDKDTDFGPLGRKIFTTYKIKINDVLYPCDMSAGDDCIDPLNENSVIHRLSEQQGGRRFAYLKTYGGVIGKIGMKIPGSPSFEVDSEKEFVFVLKCITTKDDICENFTYTVSGFNQGLCRITEEKDEKLLKCGFSEPEKKEARIYSSQHSVSNKKKHSHPKGSVSNLKDFKNRLQEKSRNKEQGKK